MLDNWTKEEGTEVVEIGSGILVVLVVFFLGLIASVMWFWPHMTPSMRRSFTRLLPCCFSVDEDAMDESSSTHSGATSSTHSTTPFTPAERDQHSQGYGHAGLPSTQFRGEVQMQHQPPQQHQQQQQWQSAPRPHYGDTVGGSRPRTHQQHSHQQEQLQAPRQQPYSSTQHHAGQYSRAPSANSQPQGRPFANNSNTYDNSSSNTDSNSESINPPSPKLNVKPPPPTAPPRNVHNYGGSPPPSSTSQHPPGNRDRNRGGHASRSYASAGARGGGSSYANNYSNNL